MIQPYRRFYRALLMTGGLAALFIAGCHKEKPKPAPSTYTPPPAPAKPTASLTADRTTINKGESVKLSWTTTDAPNVSIAPEVGAVTAQGSTTVTPASSTTYTLTASNAAGNADSTVSITVNAAAAAETPSESDEDRFRREVRDAYFDYDSAQIRADARDGLRKTADFLKGYPSMRVNIEGHCDERGSTEYNLALGDRRANAVKEYLVSLGIPADRLNTVSFGKEKPFCMESNEACWQQNRRGHFVPARQP